MSRKFTSVNMGRKLDALLGRTFKTTRFKSLLNLSVSRLAVLKNQRQIRASQARSDTTQLLNLGHQDRALLRVEHVIKEQNMLDVFVMLEGYCHLLMERLVLIENNENCPDELDEAISGLIFAASRCGEFPELQEIRKAFISRYGKDFAARAIELRNGCGVNRKIILKLSTRQPSLEIRMSVLQEIASENGITLHLQEESPVTKKEKVKPEAEKNEPQQNVSGKLDSSKLGNQTENSVEKIDREEQLSGSMKARKRYANVASAAQAAFESAAYAADAARAAVELSRFQPRDFYPDDENSPSSQRGNGSDNDNSLKSRRGNVSRSENSQRVEDSNEGLNFEKIHPTNNSASESVSKELTEIQQKTRPKDRDEKLERSLSSSTLDSVDYSQKEIKISSAIAGTNEPSEKIRFDISDDETWIDHDTVPWSKHQSVGIEAKSNSFINEFPKNKKTDTITDFEKEDDVKRLNIERKPISVRRRQGRRH